VRFHGLAPSRTAFVGRAISRNPVVIISAEASYHAAYDHCTAAYLKQAGVANAHVRLADLGVRGNGHMMMIEKNSDAIAAVIEGWLDKTLPPTAAKKK